MKTIILAASIWMAGVAASAQNIGIGTTQPLNKLQVQGNLLVTVASTATATPPTATQTKTMVNGNTVFLLNGDSTGIVYDPGGPVGNYLANLTGRFTLADDFSSVGTE